MLSPSRVTLARVTSQSPMPGGVPSSLGRAAHAQPACVCLVCRVLWHLSMACASCRMPASAAPVGSTLALLHIKCTSAKCIIPSVVQVDFMPVYQQHLRNIIVEGIDHPEHREQPLKGFHIVLDAGNGGGGFLATQVLEPLGANIQGTASCASWIWETGMRGQAYHGKQGRSGTVSLGSWDAQGTSESQRCPHRPCSAHAPATTMTPFQALFGIWSQRASRH